MTSHINCDNPVFIYGCARSGTSLLSRILNSHPRIAVPYESHLYNTFMPWLKHYGDLSVDLNRKNLAYDIAEILHDWQPRLDPEAAFYFTKGHDFHSMVDGVMYSWAMAQGKERWGEKSPWHVLYWKEILEGFPRAKFLHIVRDGRDSSASWKQARFGPKHYYLLAERWKQYLETVAELKAEVGQDNVFEFRYEDLLANPELVMHQICDFIEEEYSPDMLAFHEDKTPYPTDVRNLENLTKPLMQGNTQKWKTNLSDHEVLMFEAVASEKLAEYGYEVANDNPSISSLSVLFIRYVIHPMLRIRSMVKNTKGQIDELKKLNVYLRLRLDLKRSLGKGLASRGDELKISLARRS